nr:PREDICTED: N-acetyllactosaminide beta-1,3-N-acetylglucosaminyltransferase 4-like [Lepisosteus oculatus]
MESLRSVLYSRLRWKRLALAFLLLLCAIPLLTDFSSDLHRSFLQFQHQTAYPTLRRPGACAARGSAFLLLAIKSEATNADRRTAIRSTWGQVGVWGGRQVQRVFLLGRAAGGEERALPQAAEALVAEESTRHGDVLQWDFQESFFNVTLKELLFWRWFEEECAARVPYVLKGDDDVFVDVGLVLGFLSQQAQQAQHRSLYVGKAFVSSSPVRVWWNKYYIPMSMYSSLTYPPYLGGGGYLLSGQTIQLLLQASQGVPLFPIDDAYVGMCAQAANVTAEDHPGFMPFEFSTSLHPCAYQGLMVLHKLEPNEMYLLWSFYTQHRQTCRGHHTLTPRGDEAGHSTH